MAQKDNSELRRNLLAYFPPWGSPVIPLISTDNISNPPTDAQLDTAFDTPANLPDPFLGIVDDNNLATTVWIVVATNGAWFYVAAMTKAV